MYQSFEVYPYLQVPDHNVASEAVREGGDGIIPPVPTPDSPQLNGSQTMPQAPAIASSTAHSAPSSPIGKAEARGRADTARSPVVHSQDRPASEASSLGPPPNGQALRENPVSTAGTALELPNGAWTTAPAVPKTEPAESASEAVGEGSAEKKPAETDANRPPAVAEKDRQVWEMSQRAKAAALASPPAPGLLSQALAYIMAQASIDKLVFPSCFCWCYASNQMSQRMTCKA